MHWLLSFSEVSLCFKYIALAVQESPQTSVQTINPDEYGQNQGTGDLS